MGKINAVILDFDDTLCLTEETCFGLENEALVQMGRKPMDRAVHLHTWGKPLFTAIEARSPGIDVAMFRVVYEPLIKRWVEEGKLDTIPDKNIATLEKLVQAGKQLIILTSRTRLEMEHVLEPTHSLNGHIEAFYYKDNMKYHKPDPRAFAHIEAEHGWAPDECVYVGDSTSDALAAKQAGLHFIASLESGLRIRDDFKELSVDAFISDFTELPTAIEILERT